MVGNTGKQINIAVSCHIQYKYNIIIVPINILKQYQ